MEPERPLDDNKKQGRIATANKAVVFANNLIVQVGILQDCLKDVSI
jgi:hypothetical protein